MQVLCGLQGIFLLFNCQTPDFDCEYTYNNINNVVDIIINKEWTT